MKILGFDLGSKTLGVAVSDYLEILASPVGTYYFLENDLLEALKYAKIVINEYKASKVVLGLPKNMDGSLGAQANYSLEFKKMLENEFKVEVIMIDERLTSKMAKQAMLQADLTRNKQKKNIDKIAACLILQAYLDTKK